MGTHSRVLIANRGEIAIRIAKAAAGLGIESLAVHPAADARSLHTRTATSSVQLEAPATDPIAAYLDIDQLVRVATEHGCDCVHPGYGFLAENAAFAQRCADEGLTFIGPSPEALALFGDKVQARQLARSLGVPVVAGSDGPVASAEEAAELAVSIGYPVMLKAAAGGGGRGIRAVHSPEELADAFARCASEAAAAFGDGTVFLEQLVERPRHIEVQVLADIDGNVVHLHDRDCSVQQRNQKVVEIAPAPGLGDELRSAILADAVELVRAAGYRNAGTVEFLVSPETGRHFFIEANARIQVEHTVTEEVTGIDLVEAQFLLAGGATLASLGLGHQEAVGSPRGYAVQARVVARGPGTITAYQEPSGPGVRVDGSGYAGYAPAPQFDPLLAKVIATSGTSRSLDSAVDRASRALADFHLAGLDTNLAELRRILAHPAVRSGDARTTLLAEQPELLAASGGAGSASPLASLVAPTTGGGAPAAASAPPTLELAPDHRGVACPLDSTVVEVQVAAGDRVGAGDGLVVLSAMKMETLITAPCAGVVVAVADLTPGATVLAGQVLVGLEPSGDDGATPAAVPDREPWAEVLGQVRDLHRLAEERLAPGSTDPGVVRQRDRGKLTCRERIDLLLDDGSFREVGSVTGFATYAEDGTVLAFTPSNHVGGHGTIDRRPVVVCADDFTSRGGHSDGSIRGKAEHLDRLSVELQIPSIRLLDGSSGGGSVATMIPEQRAEGESKAKESSGAITAGRPRVAGGGGSFLPGHLGSTLFAKQLATVPVVNLLLGSVVGLGAAKAVLGHFSVMVRDMAQLFVAGPPVVRHAVGYDVTKEELGGWHIHCRNGAVDNLAESEEEAMAMAKRFLSYLPASVYEAPTRTEPGADDAPDRRDDELAWLIPRRRTTTFDIRRAIDLMADRGSFFEVGPLWGTDQVTGFARFNGHPVGVIASDSRHPNGGALTAAGCDKLTRHLDLCDLFHLPVLNLVDNPGFAVGVEHEIAATIRRGGTWMIAFAQVDVPMFTVVMRRSFGVAGNNYATPRSAASLRVAWPSADMGGIPPEGGIEAAYKRQLAEADDPEALRAELEARIESVRGPLGPLSRFEIEEMVDPVDTRQLVCEWVEVASRLASRPDRLAPRPLQFRP